MIHRRCKCEDFPGCIHADDYDNQEIIDTPEDFNLMSNADSPWDLEPWWENWTERYDHDTIWQEEDALTRSHEDMSLREESCYDYLYDERYDDRYDEHGWYYGETAT